MDKDKDFTVREFVLLDVLVALFFWAMFFYGLFNTKLPSETQRGNFGKMLFIPLGPAIFYTYKALNKRAYITINKKGIYIGKFFLTDWKNFVSARTIEKQLVRSFKDHFYLLIDHYVDMDYYSKEVPLTNTQNKAEEEIIAAIDFFYELWKQNQVAEMKSTS